jgi:hypothetical protein
MKIILAKILMLLMFLLAVTCGWAGLTLSFPASLFNILLGILCLFFLFRGLELVDKINKLGPYSPENDNGHVGTKDSESRSPSEE